MFTPFEPKTQNRFIMYIKYTVFTIKTMNRPSIHLMKLSWNTLMLKDM